jgi:hypothetical protein
MHRVEQVPLTQDLDHLAGSAMLEKHGLTSCARD